MDVLVLRPLNSCIPFALNLSLKSIFLQQSTDHILESDAVIFIGVQLEVSSPIILILEIAPSGYASTITNFSGYGPDHLLTQLCHVLPPLFGVKPNGGIVYDQSKKKSLNRYTGDRD